MVPEEVIREKCWKVERLGAKITPFWPGLVFHSGGYYAFGQDSEPHCTSLESVVLGEEGCVGRLFFDVARILQVSEDWVRGYIAGQNVALAPRTKNLRQNSPKPGDCQ